MVKKVALWVLVVMVGGLGTLWVLGGKTFTYRTTVAIAAPPDRVFTYLIEKDKLMKWIDGLVESRPLDEGGVRPGAKSIEVIEKDGQRFEMKGEILRVEPNRLLEARFVVEGAGTTIGRHELAADGPGTRLTYTVEAQSHGWVRLLAPFLGKAIRERIEGDIGRLKRLVENEAQPAQGE